MQSSIPTEISSQFHRDDQGRILFFTTPPLDVVRPYQPGQAIGHSARYLAEKARRAEALKKRKAAEMEEESAGVQEEESSQKRQKMTTEAEKKQKEQEELNQEIVKLRQKAFELWNKQLQEGTERLYRNLYGEDRWRQVLLAELDRLANLGKEEKWRGLVWRAELGGHMKTWAAMR